MECNSENPSKHRFIRLTIEHQARPPYNTTFRLVRLTIRHLGSSALQYDIQARLPYNKTYRFVCLTIGHQARPPYNTALGLSALQ
ncbi:hypothetical protein KY284_013304 [Solanum tuberosum]|nr:hypothetical protein KY284_013304 [Solanum tuberosum]